MHEASLPESRALQSAEGQRAETVWRRQGLSSRQGCVIYCRRARSERDATDLCDVSVQERRAIYLQMDGENEQR